MMIVNDSNVTSSIYSSTNEVDRNDNNNNNSNSMKTQQQQVNDHQLSLSSAYDDNDVLRSTATSMSRRDNQDNTNNYYDDDNNVFWNDSNSNMDSYNDDEILLHHNINNGRRLPPGRIVRKVHPIPCSSATNSSRTTKSKILSNSNHHDDDVPLPKVSDTVKVSKSKTANTRTNQCENGNSSCITPQHEPQHSHFCIDNNNSISNINNNNSPCCCRRLRPRKHVLAIWIGTLFCILLSTIRIFVPYYQTTTTISNNNISSLKEQPIILSKYKMKSDKDQSDVVTTIGRNDLNSSEEDDDDNYDNYDSVHSHEDNVQQRIQRFWNPFYRNSDTHHVWNKHIQHVMNGKKMTKRSFGNGTMPKTQRPADYDETQQRQDEEATKKTKKSADTSWFWPLTSSSSANNEDKSVVDEDNTNDDNLFSSSNDVPSISPSTTMSPLVAPVASSTTVQRAADLLQCRDSVIGFVENATDSKDECDGLTRAYDQVCHIDYHNGKRHLSVHGDGAIDSIRPEQTKQRIKITNVWDETVGKYILNWYASIYQAKKCCNSIFVYIKNYYFCNSNNTRLNDFRSNSLTWNDPDFVFSGDIIEEEWDNVNYLVNNNLVDIVYPKTQSDIYHKQCLLLQEEGDLVRNMNGQNSNLNQQSLENQYANTSKHHCDDDAVGAGTLVIKERALEHRLIQGQIGRVLGDNGIFSMLANDEKSIVDTIYSTFSGEEDTDITDSKNTANDDDSNDDDFSNKTDTVSNVETKTTPKIDSITIPTNSLHLSVKSAEDAVIILDEGDKLNMQESLNQTNIEEQEQSQGDAVASIRLVGDSPNDGKISTASTKQDDPTPIQLRLCCASIINAFHELCNQDEDEDLSDSRLVFCVMIVACCGIVKSLIRHFKILWLPEAAGCIMVGVAGGYAISYFPHHDVSFDEDWFLRILVPPIIFEAALSIDKRSFHRHLIPIMIYSVVGTVVATILTALIVHYGTELLSPLCMGIPFVEALTFGALISSIDPIAILSTLSNMGMTDTDTIYVLIFGESLLNDGVAIVLFHTLVHFLDEDLIIDQNAIIAACIQFFAVAFGSLFVGIAAGILSTFFFWLFYDCQTPLVEVIMFFCWALLPYYVCDGIGWSGIVAAVAVGFFMDIYIVGEGKAKHHGASGEAEGNCHSERAFHMCEPLASNGSPQQPHKFRRPIFNSNGHLSAGARAHIGFVTEIISTSMETAIFAYLGFFMLSNRYHWNSFHIGIAIFACCLSRAIMVPAMGTLSNWISKIHNNKHSLVAVCAKPVGQALRPSKDQSDNSAGIYIDRRMQIALWFAGLRGAMSFALVSHVPLYDSFSGKGTRLKAEMKAMTSASIMFTVFILGGYTYYIMKQLGMSPQIAQPHETRGLMRKDRDDDYDYGDDDYDDEGLQNGIGLVPL